MKLNLKPDYTYETILTTYFEDKTPNAAPMGIIFIDEKVVEISPFLSTQTYKNIERDGCAVINFIHDLKIFFTCTFNVKKPKLPLNFFEKSLKVNAPRLKSALAHIEVETREIKKNIDRSKIIGEIITWDIENVPFLPLNRGYNLVLESIIHTTRILAFWNDSKKIKPLMDLFNRYQKLIEKVAPTGDYIEIMKQLRSIIEKGN